MKLTDLHIRQLPTPERGQKTYWEKGLGVRVSQGGSKTFVLKHHGKLYTLGRYPSMTLKMARHAALEMKVRYTSKTPVSTFSEALTAFLADAEQRLRPKTVTFYRSMLTYQDWPKTETNPSKARALKVFTNWCIDHGYRTDNPYQRLKTQSNERDRVLTDDEIKAIWHYYHPPYSEIIKLLILTGQRRNQIASLSPDWIDNDTITFPSSIMKSKRTHVIPLTSWQQQYLHQPLAFNGWSKAKQRIDAHTRVSNWRLHDIRRYFSTTMAKIGTPLHITEQILDHRSTVSGVQAIYLRYNFLPEMRTALTHYEQHVESIVA